MKRTIQLCLVLAAMSPAAFAFGHGHPIIVTTDDTRLVVTGGVAGAADGYVDQIFVETDSSGDPQDFADFSGFGPAIYWIVPGFDITGLAENSGLYLQTLARPVQGSNPAEQRVFWYWDPTADADGEVEIAPANSRMQIRKSATISALLTPTTTIAPPAIKIAAPVAADMGFHNHDLVKYLLPAPLPADGAYAFFARLTSDIYAPSDPFLVVINNGGLEGSQMLAAAAAINAAANSLPGDYNHDGKVDAVDYVVWRNTLGSTTELAADGSGNEVVDDLDYNIWRGNFGLINAASGSSMTPISVPEPQDWISVVAGLSSHWLLVGRRSRQRPCKNSS